MADRPLTVEEIDELCADLIDDVWKEYIPKIEALRDMALAHRRAVEGEKPVAWSMGLGEYALIEWSENVPITPSKEATGRRCSPSHPPTLRA